MLSGDPSIMVATAAVLGYGLWHWPRAIFHPDEEVAPQWWIVCILVLMLVDLMRMVHGSASRPPPHLMRPPEAPGAVPILGHALRYKEDPAAFLSWAVKEVGAVFRVNLAGKRMVVVGPLRSAIQAVATASESKLSARRAVADIGFEQTLGPRNVYEGTDVHKLFLKEAYGGGRLDDEVAPLWEALGRALRRELAAHGGGGASPARGEAAAATTVPDLFALVRATVLRCQVERLLGAAVLEHAGDEAFVAAFMGFQDAIEDATAKAAVLPRALALPLVRRRRRLRRRRARHHRCHLSRRQQGRLRHLRGLLRRIRSRDRRLPLRTHRRHRCYCLSLGSAAS